MSSLNLKEICEKLQSNERRLKITALELLQQKCSDHSGIKESDLQNIYDECYLYLLRCYTDRYESVREQVVTTVNMFMERLPPNDYHLTNIISTLTERMAQQETVEESEEIRLLFIQQLHKLINLFVISGNNKSLEDCYENIVKILIKALKDKYHAVQREACACVALLASSADTYAFQKFSEPLAVALYGVLNHKHSQSRIAAVNALGYVALHINASDEALSRLIMEISPLLMDSMPLVRRECGALGVRLLMELRDRYSYFDRIISLVLCCLKDDCPEVRQYITPLWIKCGSQYYDENEAELSKQEISDLPAENYPENVKRPTIGCRGIVQRSLRLLKLITRESSDWKENVRLHSLKLLYQFVLHAEASMTAKLFEIYTDIARACRDDDTQVMQEAFKVADLMGRLLKYEDWCEHGFEALERNAKDGYLKCFYYMFTPALGITFEDNLRLSNILVQPEFSQTLKCEFQIYILKMIETILERTQGIEVHDKLLESNLIHKNCYIACLKVMALSLESQQMNSEELQTKGKLILERIANRCNFSMDELHEEYFANALEYVNNIDAFLDGLSEPIILLYGLIKLAKFRQPYLEAMQTKINIVFEYCADEAKIKIFSAISIAALDWNITIHRSLEESVNLLHLFICNVLEPNLSWKAGANAEAMRSLATATLCSLSQGASEEAAITLPNFAKYMPSLLEDNCITTRHYAIKCLYNFGCIPIELMKPIAYACLQRLDDPSFDIRILAASVVPKLKPKFIAQKSSKEAAHEEPNTFETDIWENFIKHCLNVLYLHYNGPEKRLQSAVKETIIELTKRYPKISKDCYELALAKTHNCPSLKELLTDLPLPA